MYSHLITALFTPPWLRQHRCTRHRRGQHEGLITHVQSLPMGACGLYGRPPQPRTPRDTKARGHPTAQTRPRSLTEHAARDRGTHTQPHQHCDTNLRRSHCNGSGGCADDGADGGLRVAPCLRTATTQMVSAAHVTNWTHGRGHGQAIVGGQTCARCCFRRSGRSSEAGTHPRHWQGRT